MNNSKVIIGQPDQKRSELETDLRNDQHKIRSLIDYLNRIATFCDIEMQISDSPQFSKFLASVDQMENMHTDLVLEVVQGTEDGYITLHAEYLPKNQLRDLILLTCKNCQEQVIKLIQEFEIKWDCTFEASLMQQNKMDAINNKLHQYRLDNEKDVVDAPAQQAMRYFMITIAGNTPVIKVKSKTWIEKDSALSFFGNSVFQFLETAELTQELILSSTITIKYIGDNLILE